MREGSAQPNLPVLDILSRIQAHIDNDHSVHAHRQDSVPDSPSFRPHRLVYRLQPSPRFLLFQTDPELGYHRLNPLPNLSIILAFETVLQLLDEGLHHRVSHGLSLAKV
jgi:hypothetical protein